MFCGGFSVLVAESMGSEVFYFMKSGGGCWRAVVWEVGE